jgi:uncharacterized protein YdcH (DUF465 family)
MEDGIYRLFLKHQKIDTQLRLEQSRRAPDPLRLSQLKKMKLAVKDQLHRLSLRPRARARRAAMAMN